MGHYARAGKAMLMRGGACATELYLMVGCVCLFVSNWCWLSCCGYGGCVFRFLMLGAFCTLFGLNLYGFGGECVVSIGQGLVRILVFLVWGWGSSRSRCPCDFSCMGYLLLCVFGSLFWCVWWVGVVFCTICCVFLLFDVFRTSSCSGNSVPPALYDLLRGAGSSL